MFLPSENGDWKVAKTRRLESLRYVKIGNAPSACCFVEMMAEGWRDASSQSGLYNINTRKFRDGGVAATLKNCFLQNDRLFEP